MDDDLAKTSTFDTISRIELDQIEGGKYYVRMRHIFQYCNYSTIRAIMQAFSTYFKAFFVELANIELGK